MMRSLNPRFLWLLILACLFITMPAKTNAANFDCTSASDKVKKMICGDTELSRLDEELAVSYEQAIGRVRDKKSLRILEQRWLKDLRLWDKQAFKACHKEECLKLFYRTRIAWLSAYSDASFLAIPSYLPGIYKDMDDSNSTIIELLTPIIAIVKMFVTNRDWSCDFSGYGTWNGSSLVVTDEMSNGMSSSGFKNNCIVELTFKDGKVTTKARGKECDYYCGHNASLDGNTFTKESTR